MGITSVAHCQYLLTLQDSTNLFFGAVYEEPQTKDLIVSSVSTRTVNGNTKYRSSLLRINGFSGVITHSVTFPPDFIFGSPILPHGSSFVFSGVTISYDGAGNYSYRLRLFKVDPSFNVTNTKNLDSTYNAWIIPSKLCSIGSRIYLGYYTIPNPNNSLKLFKLDNNSFAKLDSVQIQGNDITGMESYGGTRLLIAGNGFANGTANGNIQVAELDTVFTVKSRLNLDSISYVPGCGQKIGVFGGVSNISSIDSIHYALTGYYSVASAPSCTSNLCLVSAIQKRGKPKNQFIACHNGKDVFLYSSGTTSAQKFGNITSAAYVANSSYVPVIPAKEYTDIQILRTDTAGSIVWNKLFGGDAFYLPVSVYATSDTGAVICGLRYDSVSPKINNACEAFILRLNKKGNSVFTTVIEQEGLYSHNLKCYPNPAKDHITFALPFPEQFTIAVFDVFGRHVLNAIGHQYQSPLQITGLKPGLYIYKITVQNRVYSGKFVKE